MVSGAVVIGPLLPTVSPVLYHDARQSLTIKPTPSPAKEEAEVRDRHEATTIVIPLKFAEFAASQISLL